MGLLPTSPQHRTSKVDASQSKVTAEQDDSTLLQVLAQCSSLLSNMTTTSTKCITSTKNKCDSQETSNISKPALHYKESLDMTQNNHKEHKEYNNTSTAKRCGMRDSAQMQPGVSTVPVQGEATVPHDSCSSHSHTSDSHTNPMHPASAASTQAKPGGQSNVDNVDNVHNFLVVLSHVMSNPSLAKAVEEASLHGVLRTLLVMVMGEAHISDQSMTRCVTSGRELVRMALQNCDRTSMFSVLIQMLLEVPQPVLDLGHHETVTHMWCDLVIRCLRNISRELRDTVQDLDLGRVLLALETFYSALGLQELCRRWVVGDRCLRMADTVLHEVCQLKGEDIHLHTQAVMASHKEKYLGQESKELCGDVTRPILLQRIQLHMQALSQESAAAPLPATVPLPAAARPLPSLYPGLHDLPPGGTGPPHPRPASISHAWVGRAAHMGSSVTHPYNDELLGSFDLSQDTGKARGMWDTTTDTASGFAQPHSDAWAAHVDMGLGRTRNSVRSGSAIGVSVASSVQADECLRCPNGADHTFLDSGALPLEMASGSTTGETIMPPPAVMERLPLPSGSLTHSQSAQAHVQPPRAQKPHVQSSGSAAVTATRQAAVGGSHLVRHSAQGMALPSAGAATTAPHGLLRTVNDSRVDVVKKHAANACTVSTRVNARVTGGAAAAVVRVVAPSKSKGVWATGMVTASDVRFHSVVSTEAQALNVVRSVFRRIHERPDDPDQGYTDLYIFMTANPAFDLGELFARTSYYSSGGWKLMQRSMYQIREEQESRKRADEEAQAAAAEMMSANANRTLSFDDSACIDPDVMPAYENSSDIGVLAAHTCNESGLANMGMRRDNIAMGEGVKGLCAAPGVVGKPPRAPYVRGTGCRDRPVMQDVTNNAPPSDTATINGPPSRTHIMHPPPPTAHPFHPSSQPWPLSASFPPPAEPPTLQQPTAPPNAPITGPTATTTTGPFPETAHLSPSLPPTANNPPLNTITIPCTTSTSAVPLYIFTSAPQAAGAINNPLPPAALSHHVPHPIAAPHPTTRIQRIRKGRSPVPHSQSFPRPVVAPPQPEAPEARILLGQPPARPATQPATNHQQLTYQATHATQPATDQQQLTYQATHATQPATDQQQLTYQATHATQPATDQQQLTYQATHATASGARMPASRRVSLHGESLGVFPHPRATYRDSVHVQKGRVNVLVSAQEGPSRPLFVPHHVTVHGSAVHAGAQDGAAAATLGTEALYVTHNDANDEIRFNGYRRVTHMGPITHTVPVTYLDPAVNSRVEYGVDYLQQPARKHLAWHRGVQSMMASRPVDGAVQPVGDALGQVSACPWPAFPRDAHTCTASETVYQIAMMRRHRGDEPSATSIEMNSHIQLLMNAGGAEYCSYGYCSTGTESAYSGSLGAAVTKGDDWMQPGSTGMQPGSTGIVSDGAGLMGSGGGCEEEQTECMQATQHLQQKPSQVDEQKSGEDSGMCSGETTRVSPVLQAWDSWWLVVQLLVALWACWTFPMGGEP